MQQRDSSEGPASARERLVRRPRERYKETLQNALPARETFQKALPSKKTLHKALRECQGETLHRRDPTWMHCIARPSSLPTAMRQGAFDERLDTNSPCRRGGSQPHQIQTKHANTGGSEPGGGGGREGGGILCGEAAWSPWAQAQPQPRAATDPATQVIRLGTRCMQACARSLRQQQGAKPRAGSGGVEVRATVQYHHAARVMSGSEEEDIADKSRRGGRGIDAGGGWGHAGSGGGAGGGADFLPETGSMKGIHCSNSWKDSAPCLCTLPFLSCTKRTLGLWTLVDGGG